MCIRDSWRSRARRKGLESPLARCLCCWSESGSAVRVAGRVAVTVAVVSFLAIRLHGRMAKALEKVTVPVSDDGLVWIGRTSCSLAAVCADLGCRRCAVLLLAQIWTGACRGGGLLWPGLDCAPGKGALLGGLAAAASSGCCCCCSGCCCRGWLRRAVARGRCCSSVAVAGRVEEEGSCWSSPERRGQPGLAAAVDGGVRRPEEEVVLLPWDSLVGRCASEEAGRMGCGSGSVQGVRPWVVEVWAVVCGSKGRCGCCL